MSLAINTTDKLAALRQEAARMGIPVLPPDINRSVADFSLDKDSAGRLSIRYALAAVKKVGMTAMQSVVAARGGQRLPRSRRFRNAGRSAAPEPHAGRESCPCGGVPTLSFRCGTGGMPSMRLNWCCAARWWPRRSAKLASRRCSIRTNACRPMTRGSAAPKSPACRIFPTGTLWSGLPAEAEAIGFHLTAHPLDAYANVLRRLGVVAKQSARRARPGRRSAGEARRHRHRRQGAHHPHRQSHGLGAAFRCGGSFEVTCFSEVLARSRELLSPGASVLVTAEIRLEGEALRITAQDCASLDGAAAEAGAGMKVWLRATEAVAHIHTLLQREGRGRGRVVLVPRLDAEQDVEISLPGGFNISPRLAQAMKMLPGVERVEDL